MGSGVNQAHAAQVPATAAELFQPACQVHHVRVCSVLGEELRLLYRAVEALQPPCPLAHDVYVQLVQPSLLCSCCQCEGQRVRIALACAYLVEGGNWTTMPRICEEVASGHLLLLPAPRLVGGCCPVAPAVCVSTLQSGSNKHAHEQYTLAAAYPTSTSSLH